MTTEAAMIETHNLTKKFRRHDAVNGIDLRVPEKSMFALVGANGAGKTTTLRMLVNILKPDSGSARVCGVDSRRLGREERLKIGYVSENQELPERLSVEQYFEYLRALYPNWDLDVERRLRRDFELPANRNLSALSHGMRVKTMLAGALSFHPKLLVLDEPLSGLDPLVRDEVMSGLLQQADETTVVISSHEITEIDACTTHVAFMSKGRLLFQEAVESLRARFREVSVTVSASSSSNVPSPQFPDRWLSRETHGSAIRFVDSAFIDDTELSARLGVLGSIRSFESTPMSLRDIAKALMRANRTESDR